ncbi:integrin beta-PS-like [Gigantopelta aegis]|uniref:integrin beta-PS-like n=1 Tax=Gigantopelta aegis TaxID=1735272 RepID=UPI001B88C2F5|nr:integrin beta-PS-like [Gigantopelta aegis]
MKEVMKLSLFSLLVGVCTVTAQGHGKSNPCIDDKAQVSCGQCIATAAGCGWCLAESFDKENRARCDLFENLAKSGGCDPDSIVFPGDSTVNVRNDKVQDGDRPEDAVQIQPQQVRIKIRPNKPVTIPITFRQAENYPVDLYYLMDLSNSMEDDKDKLAELGNLIAASMSAITKNFRLGFGSFVDKVVMPYVSTVEKKLRVPCYTRTGAPCEAPYSFKNQLSLDLDTSLFAKKVLAANVSGNLDAPEGGFDAIMQAVVCDSDIGWRNQSRRMLVFSTDAGFHYAGDGKLGGIVKPNDGHCHMNNRGIYTESSNQDYPSVSQIAAMISQKKVNVIFAVTKDQKVVYEKLSKYIEGSIAGELADDSANIVALIRNNYKKITSKVTLNTQNAENITVKFLSKCLGNDLKETNECEGLKIGTNVTFTAEITVTECPRDRVLWNRQLEIYPVGLAEKLVVNLDLICECSCEKKGQEIPNSPLCSGGNGTYECGKCTCNHGRYGKFCECDATVVSSEESDAKCIRANSTVPCSGKGQCVCGICECYQRSSDSAFKYSGPFCECDDYSCDYYDHQLCGGPERGICKCGECQCKAPYNGTSCECKQDNSDCISANGKECNGFGTCICGSCVCDKNTLYRGPTCDECPTCPGKCAENKECVQCSAFQTGPLTREQCSRDCHNIVVKDEVKESDGVKMCRFKDDDECLFYFTYEYDDNNVIHIVVQQTKVCPESVNILAIVGGVVGGIVAVGLALLLIWKMLTMIHDRREFAKFEKERQNATWEMGENPIYKQATSTFKNPTYGGRQ